MNSRKCILIILVFTLFILSGCYSNPMDKLSKEYLEAPILTVDIEYGSYRVDIFVGLNEDNETIYIYKIDEDLGADGYFSLYLTCDEENILPDNEVHSLDRVNMENTYGIVQYDSSVCINDKILIRVSDPIFGDMVTLGYITISYEYEDYLNPYTILEGERSLIAENIAIEILYLLSNKDHLSEDNLFLCSLITNWDFTENECDSLLSDNRFLTYDSTYELSIHNPSETNDLSELDDWIISLYIEKDGELLHSKDYQLLFTGDNWDLRYIDILRVTE